MQISSESKVILVVLLSPLQKLRDGLFQLFVFGIEAHLHKDIRQNHQYLFVLGSLELIHQHLTKLATAKVIDLQFVALQHATDNSVSLKFDLPRRENATLVAQLEPQNDQVNEIWHNGILDHVFGYLMQAEFYHFKHHLSILFLHKKSSHFYEFGKHSELDQAMTDIVSEMSGKMIVAIGCLFYQLFILFALFLHH